MTRLGVHPVSPVAKPTRMKRFGHQYEEQLIQRKKKSLVLRVIIMQNMENLELPSKLSFSGRIINVTFCIPYDIGFNETISEWASIVSSSFW